MKNFLRITCCIITTYAYLSPPAALAQITFTDAGAGLPSLLYSATAWGDYDNDGDLDLALTGRDEATFSRHSYIYRNDAGTLVDINAGLPQVAEGALAWGDYDNDGDLDLLLTGTDAATTISRIYRNDSGLFTDIAAGLPGTTLGEAAWGDYDADGDLDLVLTGSPTAVFRNDSGVFTDIGAGLPNVGNSSVAWADFDRDGDQDLLLVGDTSAGPISNIYRNDSNQFVDIGAGLPGVYSGSASWGDYDSDGDLDILLTGSRNATSSGAIFRNDGGTFVDIGEDLRRLTNSSAAWGDYDNDGDLDVLACGTSSTNVRSIVFRNDAGVFVDIAAGLTPTTQGAVSWVDFDRDGDLDALLSGFNAAATHTTLYRNDSAAVNTSPTAPGPGSVTLFDGGLQLHWTTGSDTETPSAGLTYNVRVGLAPGAIDLVSPMALSDGTPSLAVFGSAGTATTRNIALGPNFHYPTVYWSAQTIDGAFAGSAFQPEQAFNTGGLTASITDIPGDQGGAVRLTWSGSDLDAPEFGGAITSYEIYRRIDTGKARSGSADKLAGWYSLGLFGASGDGVYNIVAPTLSDSTATNGTQWSVFFVRSHTNDPFLYFDSAPDSGYSVDNLAPAVPSGLALSGPTTLTWDSSTATDFNYFSVFGSANATLDGTAMLIGQTTGTQQSIGGQSFPYYHVTATDFAGNASGAATASAAVSGVGQLPGAVRFALGEAAPNPFNPSTTIRFELPTRQQVQLTVFDLQGRRVAQLVSGTMESGRHEVRWDGRDTAGRAQAAGIYLYRLDGPGGSQTKRMTLVK